MSFTLITYAALLDDYCQLASVSINDTSGEYEPTVPHKRTFSDLLTDACNYLWAFGSREFILPSLMEVASVTPTSGVIARADFQDASKWSVWTDDPRSSWTAQDGKWLDYRLYAVPDTDGLRVSDYKGDTSLTVFFQREAPVFDWRAWDTSVVYFAGEVRIESGQCYKCLSDHTSTTFATDLADGKWRLQQIPAEMAQVIKAKIMELRAGNVTQRPGKEAVAIPNVERMLEKLYATIANNAPPWLVMNGGLT